MSRRKAGTLLPLEVAILTVCLEAGERGEHGFAIAKVLADRGDARRLTASGTLYRALQRLDAGGLVESWWEDPATAAADGRPRRRMYRVTGAGAVALAVTGADRPPQQRAGAAIADIRPGWTT